MTIRSEMGRGAIDERRWDSVAAAAPLPYAQTWWLDAVTDRKWYGMALDDYRVILPLPIHRKLFGRTWIARAPFTQQSGPFGDLRSSDLVMLLQTPPDGLVSFNLPLAAGFAAAHLPHGYESRLRTNLLLDLSAPMEDLRAGYSKTLRKKLRRYPPAELSVAPASTIVEIYRSSSGKKARLTGKHYRKINQLMQACEDHSAGLRYQLKEEGVVLAAGFFPVHNGRIINLFAGSTEEGFRRDGMARLLDAVIERHRGTNAVFDFEGSDIKGVKAFFQSFGAEEHPYWHLAR